MMRKTLGFFSGVLLAIIATMLMAPSGGFPSRPRFQSVGIGQAAGTTGTLTTTAGATFGNATASTTVDINASTSTTATINTAGAAAIHRWDESDQTADNRIWRLDANGNQFIGRTRDDANTTGVSWLIVDRTAATSIDNINLIATTVQANGSTILLSPITCTTTCSGAAIVTGQSLIISKGTATSRASATVETDDPDLAITALPSARYRIEVALNWTLGAGGARYRFPGLSNSTQGSAIETCDTTTTAKLVDSLNDDTCAGTTSLEVEAVLRSGVGVSGAVAVSWAQNTSNVANTTLNTTSWLMVTRLN